MSDWYIPEVKICVRKIGDTWCVGSLSLEGTDDERWWPIKDFASEKEAKEYISSEYPGLRSDGTYDLGHN